jgi:hypothetical protein
LICLSFVIVIIIKNLQMFSAPESSTTFDNLVAAAAFVDVICVALDGSDGNAAESEQLKSLTRALMTPQPKANKTSAGIGNNDVNNELSDFS